MDLGCGPGLYCRRFSGLGFDVAGVDISRRSIDYAKNNDRQTEYLCGNYLETDFGSAFDLITMIYCDYAALTAAERRVLLKKIKLSLKPGGRFLFDVFTDINNKNATEQKTWSAHENGGFWSADPYLNLEATYLHKNRTVSSTKNIIVTEARVKEYII